MATLFLVRGYPGSSKTTFAKRKFPGTFHVENDMYFVRNGSYSWSREQLKLAVQWAYSMVKTALEAGMDVVISNTFTKRRYVKHYEMLALECGADFEVYRCIGNFKNVHGLDDKMVESFKNAMEDYPGEVIVESRHDAKMCYEVFDVASGNVYGRFPDLCMADVFIAGMDDELASQVQARRI